MMSVVRPQGSSLGLFMPISLEFLPRELHYIVPLAEQHGAGARVSHYDATPGRHVKYGERLSEEDMKPLRQLYAQISAKGHGPLINSWHQSQGKDACPPETTWPVYGLLCLFQQLGDLGFAPFNDGIVGPMSGEGQLTRRMDPAKIPETLRPFIPLFEKWGDGDDLNRLELIKKALDDPAEMAELKEWHLKLSQVDRASYEEWLGGVPNKSVDDSFERDKVYSTDLLMYGELEIEKR